MGVSVELKAHLEGGETTLARAWAVKRKDGVVLGFTDHDRNLSFDGIVFRADTGMVARALSQSTGLSVDNSSAAGALSSDAISEEDIAAGRYDGAALTIWMVNWADVSMRVPVFAGTLGEISCKGNLFEAELRGLAEALNQPRGRAYQRDCSAVLGDAACGFDTARTGFSAVTPIVDVKDDTVICCQGLGDFADGWFCRGRLEVQTGDAKGLSREIERDRFADGMRVIDLRTEIRAPISVGDEVRLVAGCDKRPETCRAKFANFPNFRGFPHIPGEDWLLSYPVRSGVNDGGKLRT